MDRNLESLDLAQVDALLSNKEMPAAAVPPPAAESVVVPPTPPIAPPAPVEPIPAPVAAVPPVTPEPAAPVVPPIEPPAPQENHWERLTNGKFKTEQDYINFNNQYNTLQQQYATLQSQSTFKSDRERALFETLKLIEGSPADAALNILQVQRLDLNTLPDQQARFEAYKLTPEILSSGLSQEEVRSMFIEEDTERYGDASNTELPPTPNQISRAKLATQQAKAQIAKVKEQYKAPQEDVRTPEQLAAEQKQYREYVELQVGSLNEYGLNLSATDPDGEAVAAKINIKVDNAARRARIVEIVSDPMGWWDQLFVKHGVLDANGKTDAVKFGQLMDKFEHLEANANLIYAQGRHDAIAKMVKTHRNPALPTTPTPPPTVVKPVNEREEMAKMAFQVVGR